MRKNNENSKKSSYVEKFDFMVIEKCNKIGENGFTDCV